MPHVSHNPYRDDNLYAKYPFSDTSTLVSRSGVVIDPALFIDAMLYPVANTNLLYLESVTLDDLTATITIGNNTVNKFTGTVDLSVVSVDGTIALVDSQDRPAGVLIADPLLLKALLGWPQGATQFGAGVADFVPSCTIPASVTGVLGIHADDGVNQTGDVWLVGEDGVVLSFTTDNKIRVDVVGEPMVRRLLCSDATGFEEPRFIKTINGIPPSEWGGFTLNVGRVLANKPALRITPDNNGIYVGLAAKAAADG